MGDLYQDADTVACLAFRILTCPVFEILHDLQRIFHGLAALYALDIHACADTAVVVLEFLSV